MIVRLSPVQGPQAYGALSARGRRGSDRTSKGGLVQGRTLSCWQRWWTWPDSSRTCALKFSVWLILLV